MDTEYRHTQFGTLTVGLLLGMIAFLVILSLKTGWDPFIAGMVLVFVVFVLLFGALTTEIRAGVLEIWFGIGLIRKRFALREIEDAAPVKNHWFYGWGIRLTPHGWLYNVSGLGAVEIVLSSGKHYRIGTDCPEELAQAIQQSRRSGPSA